MGLGVFFFIISTIVKTNPPPKVIPGQIINPPPASKRMATILYSYVCFYSMHWMQATFPWTKLFVKKL